MTPEQREQKFREEFDALTAKYGIADFVPEYSMKAFTSGADFNLNFTMTHFNVVLNPNWQPPQELKPAQADLPEPAPNGAKQKAEA